MDISKTKKSGLRQDERLTHRNHILLQWRPAAFILSNRSPVTFSTGVFNHPLTGICQKLSPNQSSIIEATENEWILP